MTRFKPYGEAADQHVKVSFFGTIGFGRVGDPELTDDGTMQVATLDDLMATKVKVPPEKPGSAEHKSMDIPGADFYTEGVFAHPSNTS